MTRFNWALIPIEKALKWYDEGICFPVNGGRVDYLMPGMDKRQRDFFEKMKHSGKGVRSASKM